MRKSIMCLFLLFDQLFSKIFSSAFHVLQLSVDQPVHCLDVFLDLFVTFVDRSHPVELMIVFAKDTIGTE
jgi:hypothetical protein